MPIQMTRRQLIAAGAGAAALGAFPGDIAIRSAMAADTKVRMSTGLRAAAQSIAWIGSEAGVFRKHGLDVSFPKLEVGGPEAAAGMMRGDWEFCQTPLICASWASSNMAGMLLKRPAWVFLPFLPRREN